VKREELREQLLRVEEEAASQTSKAAQLSRQLAHKEEEMNGKYLDCVLTAAVHLLKSNDLFPKKILSLWAQI